MMPLSEEKDNPDQWGFKIINKPLDSNPQGVSAPRISKTRASTRQFGRVKLFTKRDSGDDTATPSITPMPISSHNISKSLV